MSAEIELWRGAAAAWECDHLGHLNTRFYAAKVERALPPLIVSLNGADRPLAAQHLRFHKEVRAGTPLHAVGRGTRWDEADGELLISLVHSQGGELAATCRLLYGDPARPSPDLPDTARERGLSMVSLAQVTASGARADVLGLDQTALTTVLAGDGDAMGRWRLPALMGLIADASLHLRHRDWREVLAANAPGGRTQIGNVLLEIGIVHHRWPTVGDRVAARSALTECNGRITRTAHWLIDPDDGAPWATATTVGMPLDLDARRPVPIGPEAQAAFRAVAVAGV